MTYLSDLTSAANRQARTENGAVTLRSTNNPLVDFFALAGSTRQNPSLGLDLFKKAFAADRQAAIRVLFYLRDVRGGQGERALFRNALAYLAEHENELTSKIVMHVPEYGRWDDLFVLQVEAFMPMLEAQLTEDVESDTPTLLAKWMPSENTSSKTTRALARGMMKALGYSSKKYRQTLSKLRAKIKLVEQEMSKKEWSAIDYSKVPSQASLKYRKAFGRNDFERYSKFLEKVVKGEAKINTSTLYPYQVYNVAGSATAEALWANLPDYTDGRNALVVADTSGSMSGEPMAIAVSLALYFAERNTGIFKDHFITFSGSPTLQKIQGKTLQDKMNSIERAGWEYNTNLYKVFKLLVDTAVKNSSDPAEMPDTIYVISDMEFDQCADLTNFEAIDELYKESGYTRPQLVFWNVQARNKQVPVTENQKGVTLVSGSSASTFKLVMEGKTPLDLVMDVVNSDRYAPIVI